MVWGFTGQTWSTVPLSSDNQHLNLKEYYAAHPELHSKYRNFHAYVNQTMLKLSEPVGHRRNSYDDPLTPIEDHEWPTEFRTMVAKEKAGRLKSLLDMSGSGKWLVADQSLKELIERFEPGVHQFRPVRVTSWGTDFPGDSQFYTLLIDQFIDSFSPKQSDPDSFTDRPDSLNDQRAYTGWRNYDRIALSRAVFGGAHLWREKCVRRPTFFMSDELRKAIKEAGLKTPPFVKMKEVA